MQRLIFLFPLFFPIISTFKFNIPLSHGDVEQQHTTYFNTDEGVAYQVSSSGNGFGFEGAGTDLVIGVGETEESIGGITFKPALPTKSDKALAFQCQANSFQCKYTDTETVLHFYRSAYMKEYSQFKLVNIPMRVNETNQDDCKPYAHDICYMHIQLSETTFRYKTQVALYDHDFNSTIVKARVRKGCGWLASLNSNSIFGDANTTPTVVSGYFGDMWCMTSSPYPSPSYTADDVKGSDRLFIDYNANIYQSLINAQVATQEQICIYDPCKALPNNLETITPTPSPNPNPDPDDPDIITTPTPPNQNPNPDPDPGDSDIITEAPQYNIACYSCQGKNCEGIEQCKSDENVCSKTDLNGVITRSCHKLRSNEEIGCNVAGSTIQCYCESNYCNSASAFSTNLSFILMSIGLYFRLTLW